MVKQELLQKTVINLEHLQCPKYTYLQFPGQYCTHPMHFHGAFRCALREAASYAQFVKYLDLVVCIVPKSSSTMYIPTPTRHVE